jgi:hypothetical protein
LADETVIIDKSHADNDLAIGQDSALPAKKLADSVRTVNETPSIADYLAQLPRTYPWQADTPRPWGLLTYATGKRICDALRMGHTRGTAAKLAGISGSALSVWMGKGDTEDDTDTLRPYIALRCAVLIAESEAEDTSIRSVRDAGEKDWKAHAWWLSRRHSDAWAERSRQGESVSGVTINVGIALPAQGSNSTQAIDTTWVSVPELPGDD